jgi:hypothetical protein
MCPESIVVLAPLRRATAPLNLRGYFFTFPLESSGVALQTSGVPLGPILLRLPSAQSLQAVCPCPKSSARRGDSFSSCRMVVALRWCRIVFGSGIISRSKGSKNQGRRYPPSTKL